MWVPLIRILTPPLIFCHFTESMQHSIELLDQHAALIVEVKRAEFTLCLVERQAAAETASVDDRLRRVLAVASACYTAVAPYLKPREPQQRALRAHGARARRQSILFCVSVRG